MYLIKLILSSCLLLNSQALIAMSLYSLTDTLPTLEKNYGFLLLKLTINSENATVHYARIKSSRSRYLLANDRYKLYQSQKINLNQSLNGYYVLPLPAGIYQITQIDSPFYDLPYSLNLTPHKAWRFAIEAGYLNYAGELVIAKEREQNSIDVDLLNRFAADQQELRQQTAILTATHPLRLNPGFRDDFQQALEQQIP